MTAFLRSLSVPTVVLAIVACGDGEIGAGSSGGGEQPSGAGPSTTGAGGETASTSGSGGAGAGTGGAPPCTAETLAEATRTTSLSAGTSTKGRVLTAERGSRSVVAWAENDGKVHIQPLDAVDAPEGARLSIDATQVYGLTASASDIALLVSRAPDYMSFVRLDPAGQVLASADLVGGGDHGTIGVEWFGEFATTGRLVARGDGSYAAYHALHRRWPDDIGHQGDTLRLLSAGGDALSGGWGWGCSHSMDQRLAVGPNGVVPICISDCFPEKGIWFRHDASQLTGDPGANCQGGYTTELGGLVATSEGFVLVYGDASGTSHLGRFDTSGQALGDRVLNEPGSSRLARYEGGLLLGSPASGGGSSLQRLDATGAPIGGAATIGAALPAQDFESRSDGEVAWATTAGTTIEVVRVRSCE